MLCFLLLLAVPTGFAQDDALALLRRISQKYEAYPAFEVSFDYQMRLAGADLSESIQGKATVQQNNYLLDLGDVKIYANGEATWTYQVEINEVTITPPAQNDALDFQDLLSLYKKDYKARILPLTPDGAWTTIELVPQNINQALFKIQVRVHSTQDTIQQLRLFYKDGTRYTYVLQKLNKLPKQSPSTFVFPRKKYPQAEIIDLR